MRNKHITALFSFLVFGFISAQENVALSLEEAVEYAMENNINVKQASLAIEKAQKQVWETTSTGLPQIDGSANYTYNIEQPVSLIPSDFSNPNSDLVPVIFGTRQTATVGATLTQLLFSGSYLVGLQSAKAFKKISELQKEKTEALIKENVANAYAAVLVADENIQILEKNVKVSQKNLNDITEIYKVGLTEEQNVDQISYTNKVVETALKIAKRQKQASLNTLKLLIGIPQESELMLTTPMQEMLSNVLAEPASDSIENHIDFRLADNNVTTSELQVKYQKTFALPTLSAVLNSSYNAFSDEFDFFDQRWFNATFVGVNLDVPIFSSFGRKSRTEQAKIDLFNAEIERENVKEELTQQVENARLNYENALDNLNTSKELIELSESIFKKEQTKFFEGLSTSTDLTNAENQLYDSESQYIQSIFEVIQSRNALLQALGKF